MTVPSNVLVAVETLAKAELGFLQNHCALFDKANKKFENFQNLTANLGTSVKIQLPTKGRATESLVASFQAANVAYDTLTINKQASYANAFTTNDYLLTVEPSEYLRVFGKKAAIELGSKVEANLASKVESSTYRFYGDGRTEINSHTQLSTMLAYHRDLGSAGDSLEAFLPITKVPAIQGTMLAQFVLDRNNTQAKQWELGAFNNCMFNQVNTLVAHYAGVVGQTSHSASPNNVLTVISTNDPTGAAITQITCSGGPTSNANAIAAYDLCEFNDGVSGYSNVRFLTFSGGLVSDSPVQFAATAQAASDGSGHITISIHPTLCSVAGPNQNISSNIVAGMQFTVMDSHRCGLLMEPDALMVAMPRLPDYPPYPSVTVTDTSSGASLRHYWGCGFGNDTRGYVHDCIYGGLLISDRATRILFPLT
jgi:hypothetical protein